MELQYAQDQKAPIDVHDISVIRLYAVCVPVTGLRV